MRGWGLFPLAITALVIFLTECAIAKSNFTSDDSNRISPIDCQRELCRSVVETYLAHRQVAFCDYECLERAAIELLISERDVNGHVSISPCVLMLLVISGHSLSENGELLMEVYLDFIVDGPTTLIIAKISCTRSFE